MLMLQHDQSEQCDNFVSVSQILTHVKEKLQFSQKERQALQAELDSVEAALATHRDDLTRVKVSRDKAKVATRKIKDAGSHVTNTALLADMEVCCFIKPAANGNSGY